MEKMSNKIKNAVNELKETINSAVVELKNTIKVNLDSLKNVKQNLVYAYEEMNEICCVADDLSIVMDVVVENTNDACDDLENVLAVIMPEGFGDEYFEEEDEEDCLVVEDTESGEETEYPIN